MLHSQVPQGPREDVRLLLSNPSSFATLGRRRSHVGGGESARNVRRAVFRLAPKQMRNDGSSGSRRRFAPTCSRDQPREQCCGEGGGGRASEPASQVQPLFWRLWSECPGFVMAAVSHDALAVLLRFLKSVGQIRMNPSGCGFIAFQGQAMRRDVSLRCFSSSDAADQAPHSIASFRRLLHAHELCVFFA